MPKEPNFANGVLYLTVSSDGIVSLWDRPTDVPGETTVVLKLATGQLSTLRNAQGRATEPN